MMRTNWKHVETEAYNSGWLDGYDALVIDLYERFNQCMPDWLISLVGGKRAVKEALRGEADWDNDWDNDDGYENGYCDGYKELFAEIVEECQKKKVEMADFLQGIVIAEDSQNRCGGRS